MTKISGFENFKIPKTDEISVFGRKQLRDHIYMPVDSIVVWSVVFSFYPLKYFLISKETQEKL